MPKYLRCCLILLVALISESSSGAEPISKYVCHGDYVQMFQNVTLSQDNPVNLYTNGDKQTLIGTWSLNQASSVLQGYKERVFLDEYGTLSIRNIQLSDEAKYVLSYGKDASNMKSAVQIYVMVAPTKYCRPKIKKMDSYLNASLESKNCGRPSASVHLLKYPDISDINSTEVKLVHGNEVGTYYACAETPALICVKSLKLSDYCTTFTIESNSSLTVSSDTSDTKQVVTATVVLVSVVAPAIVVITILRLRRKARRKGSPESREEEHRNGVLGEETSAGSKMNELDEGTVPLLASKQAEESMVVKLQDPEHETEESTTEHQPSTDSVTTTKLQELCHASLCKVCYANEMNMVFMPCCHIATCENCSIPLDLCPVCRALIVEKMQITLC